MRSERISAKRLAATGVERTMPILWILTVLVLAGVYVPVLTEMARVWQTNTYAVHGMFVPFFSVFMLWNDRERLRQVSRREEPAGLLVILLGLGVLLLGNWTESLIVQGMSVAICMAGLALWGFGEAFLRAAAFPIGFLILMVPLPRPVIDAVTLNLQLFAVGLSGIALRFLDVPFVSSGVLIELPQITLEVAEVCNGLRFMLALLVLTIAFAQVSQRSLTRMLVLVAAAIPFAILANGIRVATIVVGVHYWGPQVASGWIHHSIGKSVWVLTLVPLVALGLIMRSRQEAAVRKQI